VQLEKLVRLEQQEVQVHLDLWVLQDKKVIQVILGILGILDILDILGILEKRVPLA
jgi:ADP-dependent phosphofructokinase/glucokinase